MYVPSMLWLIVLGVRDRCLQSSCVECPTTSQKLHGCNVFLEDRLEIRVLEVNLISATMALGSGFLAYFP